MPDISGLDGLIEKFKQLDLVGRTKTLMTGAVAGAQVIRAEASRRAPRRTGALAEHENIRKKTSVSTAAVAVVDIGPEKKQFYGYFVEKGTVARANKRGANRGAVRPHPFLQPAFDEKQAEAVHEASVAIKEAIDKI